MKFDLNKDFIDVKGAIVTGDNQAQFLAGALSGNGITKFPAVKAFDWALELHKTGFLICDGSDLKMLTDALEELKTKQCANLFIATLQKSLDKSMDISDEALAKKAKEAETK